MKRAILLLVTAALAGCASHNDSSHSAASNAQMTGQAANSYCAVNSKETVDPKVTTVYKGQVIGFCCQDCVDEFKKNPDKYVANMK